MNVPRTHRTLRAVLPLFAFSILGVCATAAFQLLVIRSLEPEHFGLLAAYLALINVAAIGSSAVRNSVAVGAARLDLQCSDRGDRTLLESLAYGGVFAIGVAGLLLTGAHLSWLASLWVLCAVIPYFIFARAQGLMQGNGKATEVLLWTTGSQIVQLPFALMALALGAGWQGVLFVTMLVAVCGAVCASWRAHRARLRSTARPFHRVTVQALLITVTFTWLISMDVTWVQRFSSAADAGEYGAAASLIKIAFLVPTTLALYLLPRFARNLDDYSLQLRGIVWSAAAATFSGIMFAFVLWAWPTLVTLLFGAAYTEASVLAPRLALAFLPWVVAQSLVTQLTARGSAWPVVLLVAAAGLQFALAALTLPHLDRWILTHGLLGAATLIGLVLLLLRARARRRGGTSRGDAESHKMLSKDGSSRI